MKESKCEYVKSMKLAAILMLKGFRLLRVEKDEKNPSFDRYVFHQSENLTNAIFDYINSKNGGKEYGNINRRN